MFDLNAVKVVSQHHCDEWPLWVGSRHPGILQRDRISEGPAATMPCNSLLTIASRPPGGRPAANDLKHQLPTPCKKVADGTKNSVPVTALL